MVSLEFPRERAELLLEALSHEKDAADKMVEKATFDLDGTIAKEWREYLQRLIYEQAERSAELNDLIGRVSEAVAAESEEFARILAGAADGR